MNIIYLLDLNYTLVSNSHEKRSPFIEQIKREQYRQWLVDILRGQHVILITARPEKYREPTLQSIKTKTGAEFPEAYFNGANLPPHLYKRDTFKKFIQPMHPRATFVAIESNPRTIEEYKKCGIFCLNVQ